MTVKNLESCYRMMVKLESSIAPFGKKCDSFIFLKVLTNKYNSVNQWANDGSGHDDDGGPTPLQPQRNLKMAILL